ncbi:MAG: 2,3-bisphosphoglycerate-independent phosphoglycerate mutase [Defluviitaleaceae bacterium]|nr:2,3-bisphosphoglycerate-independent phosphoglycerate mutase [Defluviitaleaceae bacterium]
MKPVVLIIMDGVALGPETLGNAVAKAYTPNLDYLFENHPWTKIKAHGTAVGLPDDSDMGNSEVGHNALGCGQIYAQGAKLVNQSIKTGELFYSQTWSALVKNAKDNASVLHFIGLLSDGNVHSNIDHLIALVTQAKKEGLAKVRIHGLLDGRDVPAQSALDYVSKLELAMESLNDATFDARIASGGGRQRITMDRYGANWPMVKAGWDTHVHGIGEQFKTATEAITFARNAAPQIIDQDLPPFVIGENGEPVGKICDNDSVVLFNFRGDRAIELSQAFDLSDFDKFDRENCPKVFYAGMLQYDGDLQLPRNFLVAPPNITNTLSELLVANKIAQYAVSETQKYGHVTYFWNGNKSEKFSEELETWQEIPSDIVPFEQRPWMKAAEITDCVIDAIKSKKYGFIRANMPNGDMVGHTGSFQAAEISVAAVDLCLGRLIEVAKEYNVTLAVCADHGNADEMFEEIKGVKSVKTAHTLNPAPFIIFDMEHEVSFKEGNFGLANVAATVADLLGIAPNGAWKESMLK